MKITAKVVMNKMKRLANPVQAKNLQRFFKTGKGQYGEGDIFYGIMVPAIRKIAKKYAPNLDLSEIQKILDSKIHEERLAALLMLIIKYNRADDVGKKEIFDFYLRNTKNINNWDLVDLTAPSIVGNWLLKRDRKILYKLARSKSLWERRIAILATFAFIKERESADALKIAEILLEDKHDLIHKAVGWMLREVGKKCSEQEEEVFLKRFAKVMPRTMLRYAIERFHEEKRRYYLKEI